MIEELHGDEVDEALDGESRERPVVIEAFAPGCGACFQVARVLALAQEHYRDRLSIYQVSVASSGCAPALARLRIQVVPSVVAYRSGEECGRLENVVDAAALWDLVTAALQARQPPLR